MGQQPPEYEAPRIEARARDRHAVDRRQLQRLLRRRQLAAVWQQAHAATTTTSRQCPGVPAGALSCGALEWS